MIRVQKDRLNFDSVLSRFEGARSTQVEPLARLSVAGHHKADISLRRCGVGGEMLPSLLNIEQAVALTEAALVLQRGAAVHQGALHAIGAPGQALRDNVL